MNKECAGCHGTPLTLYCEWGEGSCELPLGLAGDEDLGGAGGGSGLFFLRVVTAGFVCPRVGVDERSAKSLSQRVACFGGVVVVSGDLAERSQTARSAEAFQRNLLTVEFIAGVQ